MTVYELIEVLKEMPMFAEVIVDTGGKDEYDIDCVLPPDEDENSVRIMA